MKTNKELISAVQQKLSADALAIASNFKVEFCRAMDDKGRLVRFQAVTWDSKDSNRHHFLNVKFI